MNIHTANKEKAARIADFYGLDSQLSIAQEELAELIQSLSKLRRAGPWPCPTAEARAKYTEARGSVSEEMADVLNLLMQLTHLLRNERVVGFWLEQKLERTIHEIEKQEARHG